MLMDWMKGVKERQDSSTPRSGLSNWRDGVDVH